MTEAQAKLELYKIDRKIEHTLIAHNKELGQHNKNCIFNELRKLWGKKKTLQNILSNF